jgi:hypothetical protein
VNFGGSQTMGANPDADTSIYSRAISISDQRFTEEPRYETVEKKVIRRAEVPFLRKVKVPTNNPVVTMGTTRQRVPTKRIITTSNGLQEIEAYTEIDVPTEMVDQKAGYRVDEVEDRQLVEIEEIQRFEMRPVPVGEPQLLGTRVLGRIPGVAASQRLKGEEVFHPEHPVLQSLDTDSRPSTPLGSAPKQRGLGTYILCTRTLYACPNLCLFVLYMMYQEKLLHRLEALANRSIVEKRFLNDLWAMVIMTLTY